MNKKFSVITHDIWESTETIQEFNKLASPEDPERVSACVMSMEAFEAQGSACFRDLVTIIITPDHTLNNWVMDYVVCKTLKEALEYCDEDDDIEKIFVLSLGMDFTIETYQRLQEVI